MKRILPFFLLLFFLGGCTQSPAETTVATTEIIETTAPGLYVEGSEIEKNTDGVVRQFMLPSNDFYQITMMGDKLLLVECNEGTTLTALSGDNLHIGESVHLPVDISAEDAIYRVMHDGFAWYDRENKQMILLDQQLQQWKTITMPGDMEGDPVISDDGDEIFYCVPGQIRALDVAKEITRPIKEHTYTSQTVLYSAFNGTVLCCEIETAESGVGIYYISAVNGQTLATDSVIGDLKTFENQYVMQRTIDGVQQIFFGVSDGIPLQLDIASEVKPALELGSLVSCISAETGIDLALYSVTTGEQTASLSIEAYTTLQQVWADRWCRCVWIVATDTQHGEVSLLQWKLEL